MLIISLSCFNVASPACAHDVGKNVRGILGFTSSPINKVQTEVNRGIHVLPYYNSENRAIHGIHAPP